MNICIYQGNEKILPRSNVNIVIDVLRAFTTCYYAFCVGAKAIYLAQDIPEAQLLQRSISNSLLIGEKNGYKIEEFDYGNSPVDISKINLRSKNIILKTSNGTKATLNSLNADHLLVTGFINMESVIRYVTYISQKEDIDLVNIVASDPISDDDLVCAEYIQDRLTGKGELSMEDCRIRIKESKAAQKFVDPTNTYFKRQDLDLAIQDHKSNFVMTVKTTDQIKIEKHEFDF